MKNKIFLSVLSFLMVISFLVLPSNTPEANSFNGQESLKIEGLESIRDVNGNQIISEDDFFEFADALEPKQNEALEVKYFYNNGDDNTSVLNLNVKKHEGVIQVNLVNSIEKDTPISDEITNQTILEKNVYHAALAKGKGKPKPKPKPKGSKTVPTKTNGGSNKGDFINSHAYDRHKYDASRKSTKNRTQYGKNVDVKKLRESTMNEPDQAWSARDKGGPWRTFYRKEFNSNISTGDTPTVHHRVIINTEDSSKSTQFPLYLK
ncbi:MULTISPECIES: hypothetical protein [Bacillus]|uniref:hypothetical protein n=1 Tax=Bacillus TaxID=1386 RepID=UPI0002F88E27|nr:MULTISPECIES: hypothetical protein [Bacillus]ASL62771.1 hypothetical protein FORC47_p419 [Bacillus cereus]MCU5744505.1 Hook-associated protein 2 [Bacillus cereus]MCU9578386.1 Hook-associated protein 2 [Bacillus cereus]MDA1785004.1 Hook-associated protein 2 [Bacillus cereus]MDZ4537007.1 Hook-associated protein 2 [Bacillus cereus]